MQRRDYLIRRLTEEQTTSKHIPSFSLFVFQPLILNWWSNSSAHYTEYTCIRSKLGQFCYNWTTRRIKGSTCFYNTKGPASCACVRVADEFVALREADGENRSRRLRSGVTQTLCLSHPFSFSRLASAWLWPLRTAQCTVLIADARWGLAPAHRRGGLPAVATGHVGISSWLQRRMLDQRLSASAPLSRNLSTRAPESSCLTQPRPGSEA